MLASIVVGILYLGYAIYVFDLGHNRYHFKFKQMKWMYFDMFLALAVLIAEIVFEVLRIHVRDLINSQSDFSLSSVIIVFTIIYSLLFPLVLKRRYQGGKVK